MFDCLIACRVKKNFFEAAKKEKKKISAEKKKRRKAEKKFSLAKEKPAARRKAKKVFRAFSIILCVCVCVRIDKQQHFPLIMNFLQEISLKNIFFADEFSFNNFSTCVCVCVCVMAHVFDKNIFEENFPIFQKFYIFNFQIIFSATRGKF